MTGRIEEVQSSPTLTCRECGHDRFRRAPRLAAWLHPLHVPLLLAAPIAWFSAPSPWSWLPAAAEVALLALTRFGGSYYWGGFVCRRCGHAEILR